MELMLHTEEGSSEVVCLIFKKNKYNLFNDFFVCSFQGLNAIFVSLVVFTAFVLNLAEHFLDQSLC